MTAKISTTSLIDMKLNYRMPKENFDTSKNHNPVLHVFMPARGLLVECDFPSENHFEEFKRQNESYITSGVIIIGDKVKGAQVEKQSKDINIKTVKKVEAAFDKAVDRVKDMAKDAKINMRIDTVKE